MTFKEIKPGSTVYAIVRKGRRTIAYTASVKSACKSTASKQAVEFVIEFNGKKTQYCLPAMSSVTATEGNGIVLCADKDCFLREVEAIKATANDLQIERDCETIIAEHDRQVEARFEDLEGSLSELSVLVNNLAKKFK